MQMKNNKRNIFGLLFAIILASQGLVILLSWIISAVWPDMGINSLLSGAGLRWLINNLVVNETDSVLVSLLLLSFSWGTFVYSELPKKIILWKYCSYKERFGMGIFFFVIFVFVSASCFLYMLPHSPMLDVTGHISTLSLLGSLLVLLSVAIFTGSMTYILISEHEKTAEKALVFGIQKAAPVIVIYIMLKELLALFTFVNI